MLKKTPKAVVLLLVLFMLLSGCSSAEEPADEPEPEENGGEPASEPVEISLFHYKETVVDGYDQIIAAFMEDNPNVDMTQEMLATEYNTVLMTKINSGEVPDIFVAGTVGERALSQYIEEGLIQEISDMEIVSRLPEDLIDSVRMPDGSLYVLPFLNTARGIIYNQDLFEEAGIEEIPKTLSEMEAACQQLEANGVTPFAVGAKDGWTLGSLPWQVAQEIVSSPEWLEAKWAGEASFADNAEPAFDFLDVMIEYGSEDPMDNDFMAQVTEFATGEAAMMVQGPWAVETAIDMEPAMADKASMMAIPATEDPADAKLYFDVDQYFVFGENADLDAIDDFFLFIYEGEGREIFSDEVATINAFGIDFDSHAVNDAITSYLNDNEIISNYQYNNMPDGFWQANAKVMQNYVMGNVDRQGALEMFDEEWRTMVRE